MSYSQTMQFSAAQTASAASTQYLDLGDHNASTLAVTLNVSALSGTTPSIIASVQWSNDGTTWADAETPDTFAAITTTKRVVKTFTVKAAFARLAWTITGTTPSLTIDAAAYAV